MSERPNFRTSRRRPFEDRFFEKLAKDDATGCWNWLAAKTDVGYGMMSRGNGSNLPILAHRAAYEHFKGPIPPGVLVLHSCDNRRCVNPDHLHLGSPADNSREMAERNRSTRANKHPNRKLSADMIPLIRDLSKEGVTYKVIAAMCGVTEQAIGSVVRGVNWPSVGATR